MPKQMSRRQKRAAAARERKAEERKAEELALQATARRLKTMTGGFSSKATVATSGRHDPRVSKPYRRPTPDYPSAGLGSVSIPSTSPVLSAEMQEREAAAQVEIAKKRKRVAPLWNKGGLQFISDGMDLTTIGRKV